MLKIYLQIRNALIKNLYIKSVGALKIETKKVVKKRLGKKLTKSYLFTGKTHEFAITKLFALLCPTFVLCKLFENIGREYINLTPIYS